MKKKTLLFLFITLSFFVRAQSYIGFLSDNYSGVHSVIFNPANIVDSPFKIDVNLVGFSAFGGNDYYGVNIFDAIKSGYSFNLESKKYPLEDNRAVLNGDILGPSFMFNLSKNSSIAMYTRARFFVNVNEVNGASITAIDNDDSDDFILNEGDISGVGHAWGELGVSYARVLLNKNEHLLKGGLTLKYLQGIGSAYVIGKDVTVAYDADGTDLGGGESTGSISSTGNLNFARFDDYDNDDYDFDMPNNAKGFGSDFGLTYEWSPNKNSYDKTITDNISNQYKLKVGLSITDIGFVDYKEGIREAYNITNTDVSEDEFDNSDDIGDFLNSFYTLTDSDVGYKIDLPTALHLNVDWNFNKKLFLNLNTDFSLISKDRKTANRISNIISITPRYESKWLSFYLPFSVIEKNGFRMGAGLRAGPLYLGSGSIFSALSSDNNKEVDMYVGLKIPIYKTEQKDKDKDEDGVIDKLDDCPKISGPIENNGCPWEDTDADGLLNKDDKCPEMAGPKENNGCPWTDTDGDGVLDKDDVCVNRVGTVANNGCPEEEIKKLQKTLNDYAKVILFNHAKASIKEESHKVLHEIIEVINEYPNAKFTIEGHTDSIGTYKLNQILSEERANAVKNFLVENGIDPSRLTAIGYGERKPIATNMYKLGRAKNRRVEINLIK